MTSKSLQDLDPSRVQSENTLESCVSAASVQSRDLQVLGCLLAAKKSLVALSLMETDGGTDGIVKTLAADPSGVRG